MSEPRTLAPPERRVAEVTENAGLGAYRLLTAADVNGPSDPRPGQFYMLAAAERWGGGAEERPYLPRAFSHARARSLPGGGAQLEFLLEDVGPGTHRLAELLPGDGLHLVGPLGVGFRPVAAGRRPLLVGGGIGAAPLLALEDELREAGATPAEGAASAAAFRPEGESSAPTLLLGFRSAPHAEAASLFSSAVALATDDGSAGRQALVTELLREALDVDSAVTVLACGPPPMLEGVRALCAEREVPAQLALESGMACGFGACFGCVVATRSGYTRLCLDGPVLDAAELDTALVPGAGH